MKKNSSAGKKLKWHTEKRRVADLVPFEGNPRRMSEKQVADLERSLQKFDLVEIPAVDKDNRIIAGRQRFKILILLGRGNEEIDIRVPNRKLTDEEFKEYLLRSNKNTGDWDLELLANFDPELLKEAGWEDDELDVIFHFNEQVREDDFDAEAELEKITKPATKPGELFMLGPHRLLCGDARKEKNYQVLFGQDRAQLVSPTLDLAKYNSRTRIQPKKNPATPDDDDLLFRRGRFCINVGVLRRQPRDIIRALQGFLIYRAEMLRGGNIIEYHAVSEVFDPISEGDKTPRYDLTINTLTDPPTVSVKRIDGTGRDTGCAS